MRSVEVAFASWRRLDCVGEETCRLVHASDGWMLTGHARFNDGPLSTALDYVIRCTPDWQTTSADISGLLGPDRVGWHVIRDHKGWTLNDMPCIGLEACVDIDLGFSPATNLLPLRRLNPGVGQEAHVSAAWFTWPNVSLTRLDQTYLRRSDHAVSYRSPGFATELRVDPTGFVTLYPDHWEGEVRHAS